MSAEVSVKAGSPSRIQYRIFDFLIGLCLLIWLSGGIPWHDKVILRHGADLRRAMLILGFTGWWILSRFDLFREILKQSFFLKAFRKIIEYLDRTRWRWVAWSFMLLWACLAGVLQMMAFRYPMYDVGIFHQVIWAVAHGHGFHSTISGAGQFLLDHFSPSLALLVPFFWVFGDSPLLLPILQAFLIFGGVAAWLWFAERVGPKLSSNVRPNFPNHLAAGVAVFALSFNSLWANLNWGFHESSIAFFSLSWAFALILSEPDLRGRWLALGFLLVGAFSKEMLLANVAWVLWVWSFWEPRIRESLRARWGLRILGLLLLAGFLYFESIAHPADKNYFNRYYAYLGSSLGDFVRTLFLRPWRVFEVIGTGEILRYFWNLLSPWFALPLVWFFWWPTSARKGIKHSLWLLGIVPSVLSAALSTYGPLRDPGFHYVLEIWPLLAVLTILALARIRSRRLVWAWALLGLLVMDQDPYGRVQENISTAIQESDARRRMIAIPSQESIVAHEMAGSWTANRLQVTRFPDLRPFVETGCPDWVILKRNQIAHLKSSEFQCVKDGQIPDWLAGTWVAYRVDK